MELREEHFRPAPLEAPALEATHRTHEVSPPGRADLAFRLQLPNAWVCDPASVVAPGDGKAWTPLAVFAEKDSSRPALVTVLWRTLDVEVPLDDWIGMQMGLLKVDIISARLAQGNHSMVVDIGGTFVGLISPPGQPPNPGTDQQVKAAVRAMARCDGQDIFMVWGMCAREVYLDLADDLAIAGASFQIARPPSGTGMEPIQQLTGSEPAFAVAAPASWTHQPIPEEMRKPGKSGLNLILAPSGSLDGFIRVKAIDTRVITGLNGPQLVQDATEECAEGSVQLTGNWQQLDDPVIQNTPDLEVALVTSGLVQNAPYDVHFAIVQRPPLLFCVTAVVVALATDPIASLRGRRAYKIALSSVRPA
jgi:hypothetical protein